MGFQGIVDRGQPIDKGLQSVEISPGRSRIMSPIRISAGVQLADPGLNHDRVVEQLEEFEEDDELDDDGGPER